VPEDSHGLRLATLRQVGGGWLALLLARTRRVRVRRSKLRTSRPFGDRWKGRLERLGARAALRLALRGRPSHSVYNAGVAGSSRLTSRLDRHFHTHLVTVLAAAQPARPDAAKHDRPHLDPDGIKVGSAESRLISTIVTRRQLRHESTSRATETRWRQVIEHSRLETRTAHSTRREEVVASQCRPVALAEAPPMVLRSAPRAEPKAGELDRDRRIVDEPSLAQPALAAIAGPKVELDIERIADQVLWRIERRVIAQRERLGKA